MPKTRTTPEINRPLQGGAANTTGPVSGSGGSTFPHPSTVTLTTTNSVDGGIHTHRLDITTHIEEADAHHNPVTVGNTGLSLSTQVLSLNLATTSGLQISSGLMLADTIAGSGLTITSKILAVGQGDGLTVSADAVALTTPGTLTHESTNAAAGSHTHAVTASANPGAAASLLKSDASGYLQLTRLGIATAPSYPLHVSAATQQARLDYNTSNYLSITVGSDGSTLITTTTGATGGNLTLQPAGDIITYPAGKDVLPGVGYETNIGSLQKKYLTLHAAELWVETLVAQETIATIGGRILVGPTTTLTRDLTAAATVFYVKHNQLDFGDRVYLEADGKVEFMGVYGQSIVAVDTVAEWFEISGNSAASFPEGRQFQVRGSTGNNGTWVTSSAEYIAGTNRTRITVTGNITNSTADGYIAYLILTTDYYYWVVRDLDGSGANDWYAGDAVFNTGQTGDGFIDLYSVRGVKAATEYGPSIVGNVRNSTTYNDWSAHWALGNLNGVYGYGSTAYGFAAGKYANGASFVTVDATNGIRMLSRTGGVDTVRAQWAIDGVITIGQVAASQDNIVISAGALAIRNNTTERIGLTAAGILTIKDSGGAAVITLDASAGAEITKKLTMPGANSAIAIGATPPTSASAGTGIWLDRTGMYGLLSNVVQAKLDATTGAIVAAAGKTVLNVDGVTLDADTVAGTGAPYSAPGTAVKWMRAGTSTKVGSIYGNWNVTLGVGALVLEGQYDASNRAAIALYGTPAGPFITLTGKVSIDGSLSELNVGTATGAAAGEIKASGVATFQGVFLHIHATAAQTIANNTFTALTFGAIVSEDKPSGISVQWASANATRATCRVAGRYMIYALSSWQNDGTGARELRLYKNGAYVAPWQQRIANAGASFPTAHSITAVAVVLAVTDYIEVYVRQHSGGDLDTGVTSWDIVPSLIWWRLS